MTLNDILKKIKGTVLRTEPEEEIIPEVGQVWGTPIQDLLKNKFPNRNAKGNKPTTFFPEKIPVLSYEKNASEIRIDHWIIAGSNVVRDDNRNKAADLGQARPVTLIKIGRAHV